MSRAGSITAAALVAAGVGCANKPATYRLLLQPPGHVLVPPEVVAPDLASRTFVANVAAGGGPCPSDSAAIRLQPHKGKIRATVNRDALRRQPAGWLANWSMQAETQGCIAAGLADALASRIAQSMPLDSAEVYRLLHSDGIGAGYVELGPDNRLEVRSPITAAGTPANSAGPEIAKVTGSGAQLTVDFVDTSGTIGFETAWYSVQRNTGRVGHHFAPLSAVRNIQGAIEHTTGPATDYLRFPAEAAFFRLFYKGDGNGVRAIVIAGSTLADLDRRMKAVGLDAAGCEKESAMCLVLPRRVGVNPFLVVGVNGKDVAVPLRTSVAGAIRAAGLNAPEQTLATLSVTRPFGNRQAPVEFDKTAREILNLQLMGGERISWAVAPVSSK